MTDIAPDTYDPKAVKEALLDLHRRIIGETASMWPIESVPIFAVTDFFDTTVLLRAAVVIDRLLKAKAP